MKISSFLGILAVVGALFTVYSMMTIEMNNRYDTNINSSKWITQYDYSSRVNESISPIQKSFEDIESSKGWFSFISAGIGGIFRGVTALPKLVLSSFSIGGSMITGFFSAFGLPPFILTAAFVMLTIWGIFKLIEIIQRWNI